MILGRHDVFLDQFSHEKTATIALPGDRLPTDMLPDPSCPA